MCNSCQSFKLHLPLSRKPFNFGHRCFGLYRYSLTQGTPSRSLVRSSCNTLYILYMRGLYYCYCMQICIAVLSTFHSAPAFPKTKSGAISGDYRGCKASVVELCARNLPSGGFAILSAFQCVETKRVLKTQICVIRLAQL